jgi:hypothetical protein
MVVLVVLEVLEAMLVAVPELSVRAATAAPPVLVGRVGLVVTAKVLTAASPSPAARVGSVATAVRAG